MLMFLTILFMSVLTLAVCAAAFNLAAGTPQQPEAQPERVAHVEPPRFFAQAPAKRAAALEQVPIEVLLRDIERHVRLEQAAAEAFLEGPTRDALHSPTSSPLAN